MVAFMFESRQERPRSTARMASPGFGEPESFNTVSLLFTNMTLTNRYFLFLSLLSRDYSQKNATFGRPEFSKTVFYSLPTNVVEGDFS